MKVRASGVLLHITSLPGPYGVGDMGPAAYRFADLLAQTRQSYWQILPLSPTSPAFGSSPYSSFSAFAGNHLLVSPDMLLDKGWVTREEVDHLGDLQEADPRLASFEEAGQYKARLLRAAFARRRAELPRDESYRGFCEENAHWLDDYALFMTLKNIYDRKGWFDWPAQYRDREHAAMARLRREAEEQIEYERFVQYVFFGQWLALKKYCNQSGIRMVGDAPIYVSYDSVDVWANAELFKLGERKRPRVVAGVPPDYFSETGQLWGNPVYDWERMQQNGFAWWIKRIGQNLTLYDAVRLDHFRGFAACWEVPADEKTAVNGKWVESPGNELFTALHRRFLALPIIAEDLGYITADVRELKDAWGFPGMRVLQFGFGGDLSRNIHAPHNHTRDSVVYTGTHDNNTVKGWFEEEASEDDRRQFLRYAGRTVFDNGIHQEFVRMAMISVADTVIFPIQDLLGLGSEGRMNTPSTAEGNWGWRLLPQEADPAALEWFADMTRFFGRC